MKLSKSRVRIYQTSLHSGLGASDVYLNSLSISLDEAPPTILSATDSYLASLSQIVADSSTELESSSDPEAVLNTLSSQLEEITSNIASPELVNNAYYDSAASTNLEISSEPTEIYDAASSQYSENYISTPAEQFDVDSGLSEQLTSSVPNLAYESSLTNDVDTPSVMMASETDVTAQIDIVPPLEQVDTNAFTTESTVSTFSQSPVESTLVTDIKEPSIITPVDNGGFLIGDAPDVGQQQIDISTDLSNSLTSQLPDVPYDVYIDKQTPDASNSLTSHLSDISYTSFLDEKVTDTLKEKFDTSGISDALSTATASFNTATAGLSNKFNEVTGDSFAKTNKIIGETSSYIQGIAKTFQDKTNTIVQEGSSSAKTVSDVVNSDLKQASDTFQVIQTGTAKTINTLQTETNQIVQISTSSSQAVAKNIQAIPSVTNRLVEKGGTEIQDVSKAVATVVQTEANQLVESGSQTASSLANKPFVDIYDGVVGGLKAVGHISNTIIDAVLGDVAGTSTELILDQTKASVQNLVDGAINTATCTINDIGDITLKQAIQTLIMLITAVVKILFVVLNAVIKVMSGKEISNWIMTATAPVEDSANKLSSQANLAVTDLSHKSLTELSQMLAQFTSDVGQTMMSGINVLNDALYISGSQVIDTIPLESTLHISQSF